MLPSMQTTTNNINNRCLMASERDVAHVEYDVINYYTDANPNPEAVVESVAPQQRCSRVNNNNNSTLLDVVVHSRATRDSHKLAVGQLEEPIAPPTATASGSSTASMRCKGGGNSSSKRNKESAPSTPALGVNMRVTGQCSQGGRKYMEDQFSVAYQESPLTHELEYAFFGIYDGHGGTEAALFAKEHLMLEIVKQKLFWSDNDEDVLRAIREGYIGTHFAMWREQDKWPRTANGHLSTAGTTATVAFMRREKIYIGHVGDSGIVLGYQNPNDRRWRAKQLTTDHKPESIVEKTRIQRSGGQVAIKSGVPRVVWNRPRDPLHRGPIKRRTVVDDIPFLAVARSLGDLWSYNSRCKEFVVSPDPDVKVVKIDPNTFRCLIFGTDGLWNVITPQEAVDSVREKHIIGECLHEQDVMNPSKALVDKALKTWATKKMRADNTSVVTVILTPATEPTNAVNSNYTTDVDMLADLEPLDTENNYPTGRLGDQLEHEDFDLELCGIIEEKEYLHDTPYSALAKRHLPPEPYRNFDYYIEEDEEEEYEADEQEQEDDEDEDVDIMQHSKLFNKSLSQTIANWQQSTPIMLQRKVAVAETETEREIEMETEAERQMELYGTNNNACELEQHLEHSFDSYVSSAVVNASTEYSFAESYNSLLNEQQAARTQQQQQQHLQQQQQHLQHQQQQQQQEQHQQPEQHHHHQQQQQHNTMQEILQEQQRYQQQEGYSLTQLETRREQQQQEKHQQQEVVASTSRWQPSTYLQQQPAELLALNALLQQERDEEQQLALEREQQQQQQQHHQQQQQQLLLVEASSSSSSSCSSSTEFDYASPWSENVATLQDNEVSSTLPATPTPLPSSSSGKETEPIATLSQQQQSPAPQQPQQQQQQYQTQTLPAPQQQVLPEPKLKRQMRRYRNVPNENHQHMHMQTRRRQLFKHSKGKSYIGASAAAIVAYSNSNEMLPSCSSNNNKSNNNNLNGSNSNVASGSTSNSRRRSVNNSGSISSASVMMTRRSQSLGLASGGSVSKRQLRSSICQLGQLGNLDLTKRTLRTRNVTPAANNAGSNNNNNNNSSSSSGKSNSNNNGSSVNNNNKPSHTFSKPATPTASTTSVQAATARRLRRSNEEREQRRSLRRSTLSASHLSSGSTSGNNSSSQFSKPTRQQSCSGGIAARPPPSPKKLNNVVPTLAIGTRAYTAALAAAADLTKRWSLRSSSSNNNNNNSNINNNNNAMATLVTAISCYSARSRTTTSTTSRRR
ncbi:hypothetical protein ACLKA7_001724 [Drosophila subpalustris]